MILDLLFETLFVKPERTASRLAAPKESMFPNRQKDDET